MDCDAAARRAFAALSAGLPRTRVAVVGDVILDQFIYGVVERISPEAPVPVVEVLDEDVFRLGGAANVVHNLRALGAEADLVGLVGTDAAGKRIRDEIAALGVPEEGLVDVAGRPTAVKTRVIAQHQQVVRFDREGRAPLPTEARAQIEERLRGLLPEVGAVVVSDYGKGLVSRRLVEILLAGARESGTFVAVDPKPVNAACYWGVDAVTPNTKETETMTGLPARTDIEAVGAGESLLEQLETRAVLLTRGERGMTLVRRGEPAVHIPTRARDVYDVTGAGDTTISVLTLARAAGADLAEAACLANLAAGIVVGKLGTAVVTLEELRRATEDGLEHGARRR